MDQYQFVVPTLFGLESLCAGEMRHMGMQNVHSENGRVFCTGSAADLVRLNLNLRTGERVLLMLGRFSASTFDDLFEGTRALPWELYIPKDGCFPVRGHSLNSVLHSVPACQSIIKKAVSVRLGSHYNLHILPETGALYQIQFSLMKDEASLMLDTTGPGLYKRGYRTRSITAPLRETLAAALVLLSHYRGRDPFCDPFCGSGTIVIEAAMIAKNQAPGLNRSFSAQCWKELNGELWSQASQEAKDREFQNQWILWGGDIDPQAIALSKQNAELAGVGDLITFQTCDAARFRANHLAGRVVTNPPYGERLMERSEAEQLYHSFGLIWQKMPSAWQLYLLSGHPQFEKAFGRKADKKRKLYNGMLRCDLFFYNSTK